MKIFIVLLCLFAFGQPTPVTSNRGLPNITNEEKYLENLSLNASEDDIKIYYRNRNQGSFFFPIDAYDRNAVVKAGFSSNKETVFIVHGWFGISYAPVNTIISDAVLKAKDANVFIVDWSKIAIGLYPIAEMSVPSIAKILGELINNLINYNQLNLDQCSIVGHSLGAHIAGLAGAALGGKIRYIVGLDPALPGFWFDDLSKRLDPSDAKFVEVIHTNGGLLGFDRSLGHVDYWPNGGRTQPGCELDLTGLCSHLRAYELFGESVASGGFLSRKCDSYKHYNEGKCNSAATSPMGECTPNFQAYGDYYLKTNMFPPYAQH